MTSATIRQASTAVLRRPERSGGGWPRPRLVYLTGWALYCLVLVTVFMVNRAPLGGAIGASLRFALPSAVFGIFVVRLCRALSAPSRYPLRFALQHAAAAVAFSLASLLAANALASVQLYFTTARPTFVWQQPAVVRFHLALGLVAYCALAAAVYADRFGRVAQTQSRRRIVAEINRQRSELQALRAQLNPHFLMNTLHSILALTRRDAGAAERAIDQLAGLLQYTHRHTAARSDLIPFEEEWRFVQKYLALEQLRFGARLAVSADVPADTLDCLVPTFVLQPLVENAVAHGVAPKPSGGRITIATTRDQELLHMCVADDGVGGDPDVSRVDGTGLRTLRRRLRALYGHRARLSVSTPSTGGWRVDVVLPIDGADRAIRADDD